MVFLPLPGWMRFVVVRPLSWEAAVDFLGRESCRRSGLRLLPYGLRLKAVPRTWSYSFGFQRARSVSPTRWGSLPRVAGLRSRRSTPKVSA